jgi:pantoate--beta-alanine ligase
VNLVRRAAEARAALAGLPRPLGFVPTMGALHEGHLTLVRTARAACAAVVASIFVNPTQFGPGEDYERYPRDEARDLGLLEAAGTDVAFVPSVADVYPPGAATTVSVRGALADTLEGAHRPGHFDGVCTVVTTLLDIVRPDRLYLGEKDAQQLAMVRRMVHDLGQPVEVVGVPTVREPDGLAMSSRNAYLGAAERAAAPRLYWALRAAAAADDDSAAALRAAFTTALDGTGAAPAFEVDYVALVDPDTFEPARSPHVGGLLVAALRLGGVRLIDNLRLEPPRP